MTFRHLGVWALALTLITGATAAEASRLSSRVLRTEQALTEWMAAGGRGEVPLPEYLRAPVRNLPEPGASLAPGSEPEIRLLVTSDDPQALRDAGFAVRTVAGPIVTMSAPLSRLHELDQLNGVRRVDLPMQLRPTLDKSLAKAKIDQVHGALEPPYPPSGYTGQGVVVGIIDTGIDYNHDDFKNPDNTTRILRIWDQTDGVGPAPFGFSGGTEWNAAAIDAGVARERDFDGHGTHIAGIAAGNGRATTNAPDAYTFVGAAPEARLMIVKTDFFEDSLIDAVNWAFTRSGSLPCVVNLSLGGQFGPHDGTASLDIGLSALAGPGRLIVAAAGNEGSTDLHAEKLVGSGNTYDISFVIPTYTANAGAQNDILLMDGWYNGSGSNLRFSIVTPTGLVVGPAALGQTRNQGTTDGQVRIENTSVDSGTSSTFPNGDYALFIDLYDAVSGSPPKAGTWKLRVENLGTSAEEVDIWLSYNRVGQAYTNIEWTSDIDPQETLTSPATADSVFCVGAYITKLQWTGFGNIPCQYGIVAAVESRAPFSSRGPRRDGVPKPEIVAPGMGIASSLSSNASSGEFNQVCGKTIDGKHYVSQGTSQAAPHLAGTLALMLQAKPDLSYAEARIQLIQSAFHDGWTGQNFTPEYGFGKLDAQAAMTLLTPVRLLSISATREEAGAVIRWELSETEPGVAFRVERASGSEGPWVGQSDFITGEGPFAWTDPEPDSRESWYRVVAYLRNGASDVFGPVRLDPLASRVRLWQNAPNPFTAGTVITYSLDRPREIELDVIDVHGRLVTTLASGMVAEGDHEVAWDGRDQEQRAVAAGVYFYRLTGPGTLMVRRMVLAR